ncbi:(2Fe-2S)-binding protein [Tepidamorphus sp. 3E244]|uniref:(2Fe-2S)-binding protein n=1 Tax=Tepidamorphus sp. 3E244 TaxID=3385498 RepID=UPI0038FC22BD
MSAQVKKGDQRHAVTLTVNGRERTGEAAPRMLLSDFLRHEMGCLGLHVGCEHGVCGACTILRDGRAERSCTQYAVQAEGADIRTVESFSGEDGLNDLQRAFRRHHALQCGFCTAGILASATEFLERNKAPSEAQVRDMLSGHICRCTDYSGMVRAILEVAQARGGEGGE